MPWFTKSSNSKKVSSKQTKSLSGFLLKRGYIVHHWKKRWFVLPPNKGLLLYFDKKPDASKQVLPSGKINLERANMAVLDFEDKHMCFAITPISQNDDERPRTYYLHEPNSTLRQIWFDGFRRYTERLTINAAVVAAVVPASNTAPTFLFESAPVALVDPFSQSTSGNSRSLSLEEEVSVSRSISRQDDQSESSSEDKNEARIRRKEEREARQKLSRPKHQKLILATTSTTSTLLPEDSGLDHGPQIHALLSHEVDSGADKGVCHTNQCTGGECIIL